MRLFVGLFYRRGRMGRRLLIELVWNGDGGRDGGRECVSVWVSGSIK